MKALPLKVSTVKATLEGMDRHHVQVALIAASVEVALLLVVISILAVTSTTGRSAGFAPALLLVTEMFYAWGLYLRWIRSDYSSLIICVAFGWLITTVNIAILA